MDINNIRINKIISFFSSTVKTGEHREVSRKYTGLVFAPNGRLIYRQGKNEYISDKNHVLLFPENSVYSIDCIEGDECALVNFKCDLEKGRFMSFAVSDMAPYIELYKRLREVYYVGRSENAFHTCLSIIYKMLSMLEAGVETYDKTGYVKRALEYMSDNISLAELSNEDIASELNISTVYFRKLFSEEIGVSPMKYLCGMRIEKARELLRIPDVSITELSEKLGYSSVYSFSRAFARECGIPPSEYAELYKNAY